MDGRLDRRRALAALGATAAAAWTAPALVTVDAAAAASGSPTTTMPPPITPGLFDYTGGNRALQATHQRLAAANGLAYTAADTLPSDLASYQLVALSAHTYLFSAGDLALLAAVLTTGHTIVYETDANQYGPMAPVFNQVTAALGVSITDLNQDWEDSPRCRQMTDIAADALTTGVASLGYGLTSQLSFASPARRLFTGESGQVVGAAQDVGSGRFVGIADVDVVSDFTESAGCALLGNTTFRQNLA